MLCDHEKEPGSSALTDKEIASCRFHGSCQAHAVYIVCFHLCKKDLLCSKKHLPIQILTSQQCQRYYCILYIVQNKDTTMYLVVGGVPSVSVSNRRDVVATGHVAVNWDHLRKTNVGQVNV